MTGGRPAPSNPRRGIVHRIVHVLWDLHHEVSRVEPKMGELIAFRNVVKDFPADTAVDEAMIEQRIRRAGLAVVYAPGAVVDMRGPSTLRELVRQRRRIYAGHVDLARSTGYRVSTMRPSTLLRAVARLRPLSPVRLGSIGAAATVEIASRMLGWWDVRVAGRRHVVWRVSGTTKNIEGTPELPGRPLADRPRTGRPAE